MEFLGNYLCLEQLDWQNLKRAPQLLKRKSKVGTYTFDEEFDTLHKDLGIVEASLKLMIKYSESIGVESLKQMEISKNIGTLLDPLFDPYNTFTPVMRDKLKNKPLHEVNELFSADQEQTFIEEYNYWSTSKVYVNKLETIEPRIHEPALIYKVILKKCQESVNIIDIIKHNIRMRNNALDDYDSVYSSWNSLVSKSKTQELSVKETQRFYSLQRKLETYKVKYDKINELFKAELPIFFKLINMFLEPIILIMFYTQLTITYQITTNLSSIQNDLNFDLDDLYKLNWNQQHVAACESIYQQAQKEIDLFSILKFRDKYYQSLNDTNYSSVISNRSSAGGSIATPRLETIYEETNDMGKSYYKVLYDYTSQRPGDLTIKFGDVVEVINAQGNWWHAILNGVQGEIPSNYVQPL